MRFLSQSYVIARGSVGGVTYTANQYHQLIARARTAPVNPNTTRQAQVRTCFDQASNLWRSCLDAQKLAWHAYAESCEYSGPLGNYTIPGRQMFIANNGVRLYMGVRGETITYTDLNAPVTPGFLGLFVGAVSAPDAIGTGFKIIIGNPANEDALIYSFMSRPFLGTRFRYKGPFGSESLIAVPVGSETLDSIEVIGLEEGMVYFVVIKSISAQTPCRLSTQQIVRCVAQTTAP